MVQLKNRKETRQACLWRRQHRAKKHMGGCLASLIIREMLLKSQQHIPISTREEMVPNVGKEVMELEASYIVGRKIEWHSQ